MKELSATLFGLLLGLAGALVYANWHFATKSEVASLDDQIRHAVPKEAIVPMLGLQKGSGDSSYPCPDGWVEVDDLRGKFIVGADGSREIFRYENPKMIGEEAVVLAESDIPPHAHTDKHYKMDGGRGNYIGSGNANGISMVTDIMRPDGQATAHNNLPPYTPVIFCRQNGPTPSS